MVLTSTWWRYKVKTKEGEGSEFMVQLPVV
jgi:hypothetical protein